jgi:outer membrane protein insertion porin family
MKLLALLLVVVLQTQAPDPNRIEDVRVAGNRKVPSDTIRYNLQTKRGDILNPTIVARDVRTLYAMQHFDDVTVEEEQGQSGKIVTFRVKEKPTMRIIEYVGNNSITRSEILEKLREKKAGISQENPLDYNRLKKAESIIKQMLAEKGRQNATVETIVEDMPPNAVAVTFKIDEGPKIKIEKIDIVGNEIFSDRQVKRAMKVTKETGPISAITSKDTYFDQKLAYDLAQIGIMYGQYGYVRTNILEPTVEVKPKKVFRTLPFIKPPFPWGIPLPFWRKTVDRYYITIQLEENDQYRVGDVKVTGGKEFSPEQIKAVLGLVPGEIYNEDRLRKAFDNLKDIYGSRGYVNYTAVPAPDYDEQKKLVNITVNIDEDRQFTVNRIAFAGNTTTRDKVIRREVMVDEGNVYNSTLWKISVQRLNQLGYFEEIKEEDAEVKPHPTEPEVDITLKVKEKGRNSIGFNGGVSGIGGSFLGLSYATNNFLGFGETLSVDLQGGTRQSRYQLSFTEPYLFDRPITTGFSLFSSNFRYDHAREFFGLDPNNLPQGLGFEDRLNFEQKRVGFNLFTSYPFKIWHRVGLSYGWDNSETDAINPATQQYFQAVTTQEREQFIGANAGSFGTFRSRKITPTYTYNATDGDPMAPFRGQSLTASFEFTGGVLGGNVNYFRPTADYRFFLPMNRGRNTLAVRFLGSHVRGFSGTSVPFYERFYMGGDFDIRGFDFRQIGPYAFITTSQDAVDPVTGETIKRPFDSVVPLGGDTQGVLNVEYRIPLVGRTVTLAPYIDIGNAWVVNKSQLTRQIVNTDGTITTEGVKFLPGTNSGIRTSTGLELQVMMPVINAPFRLIFAFNPNRLDRQFTGLATGAPFILREPKRDFKFTVGRTF